MMKTKILLCLLISGVALATNPFFPYKEGKGQLLSSFDKRKAKSFKKEVSQSLREEIGIGLQEVRCSYQMMAFAEKSLSFVGKKASQYNIKKFYHYLRFENLIDDNTYSIIERDIKKLNYRTVKKFAQENEDPLIQKLEERGCLLKNFPIKDFPRRDREDIAITQLRRAVKKAKGFFLEDYVAKRRSLLESVEAASLVVDADLFECKRKDCPKREVYSLYETYQIKLMAQVVEKFSDRFDADLVTLSFINDGNVFDNYVLSPTEQYRLALKMIKKDIADLKSGALFEGRPVSYKQVVEAYLQISGSDTDFLMGLKEIDEIWNPKKTLKQKIKALVNRWGPVSALLLPPGARFIVPIALLISNTFTKEEKGGSDADDTSLF